MCSYYSPVSLFPPLELISICSLLKENDIDFKFIDCIAEKVNLKNLNHIIHDYSPNDIISLIGVETFAKDLKSINDLKSTWPSIRQIIFGYLPTIYKKELESNTKIDVIIEGEPEYKILDLLKKQTNTTSQNLFRINSIKELPIPSHELLKIEKYYEPFMKLPFGMIQTTRGCAYKCNYCIKSYGFGNRVTTRTPQQVIEEIQYLKRVHKIKSLRFIDDNFTTNRNRVIEICQKLIENKIQIDWSCLSRADTVDYELLDIMRKSGCCRIYFGIESGSEKMLAFYDKEMQVGNIIENVNYAAKIGIHPYGFFMVGLENEDQTDIEKTIEIVRRSNFTSIAVEGLNLYPGTKIFDIFKEKIDLSDLPYKFKMKDLYIEENQNSKIEQIYKAHFKKWSAWYNLLKITVVRPQLSVFLIRQFIKNSQFQLKFSRIFPNISN